MEYDLEKLAREITASRLDAEPPESVAAEVSRKLLVTGVQGTRTRQAPRETVPAVCQGVMSAVLLREKDLAACAVAVLRQMADVAAEIHLDPAELMTWGMEGISKVALLSTADARNDIQHAIETNFMGAGAVFGELCARAPR